MEQKNLILGFDFGEKYSQFCCYDRGTHTAVSIPVKEGEEAVEFPTAIAKKRNEETCKTGPDAEKSAHAENGIWLDNLYEICMGSVSYTHLAIWTVSPMLPVWYSVPTSGAIRRSRSPITAWCSPSRRQTMRSRRSTALTGKNTRQSTRMRQKMS